MWKRKIILFFINFLLILGLHSQVMTWDTLVLEEQLSKIYNQPHSIKNLETVQQILALAKAHEHTYLSTFAMYYLGHYYSEIGAYEKAIGTFQDLYDIGTTENNDEIILDAYCGLGKVFRYMDILNKSLEYFRKAEQLSKTNQNGYALNIIYDGIGGVYLDQDSLDKALDYMLKGKTLLEEEGIMGEEFHIGNSNIGDVYIKMGKAQLALPYYKKYLDFVKEVKDTLNFAYAYGSLAYGYQHIPDFDRAFIYFDSSLYYSQKLKQDDITFYTYEDMSIAYQALGNYKKGLEYQKKYQILKEEIIDRQTRRQITALEVKFNTEQREKRLLMAQKKLVDLKIGRQKMWIALGILMASLIIGGLIFKKTKDDAQRERKLQIAKEEVIQKQLKIN